MRLLRTNTATRVSVGPFIGTDGLTPKTALTVTNCKLTMTVDDGGVPTLVLDTNPTASGGNNDMVHITGDDAGMYDLELAAANVNYLGRAMLVLTDAANHCPVFAPFMIVPAMIYDSLVLGTDRLDTNVTHIGDTAQTARDLGLSVLVGDKTGFSGTVTDKTGFALTAAYDAAKTAAQAGDAMTLTGGERTAIGTAIEVRLIDELDGEAVIAAFVAKIAAANPTLSELSLAAIATQVRTELAAELARIDVAISSRLSTLGYTAAPDATAIQTAAAAALTAYDPPTKTEMDTAIAAIPAAPTVEETADAVLVAAQATPIHADARAVVGTTLEGDGSDESPWQAAS